MIYSPYIALHRISIGEAFVLNSDNISSSLGCYTQMQLLCYISVAHRTLKFDKFDKIVLTKLNSIIFLQRFLLFAIGLHSLWNIVTPIFSSFHTNDVLLVSVVVYKYGL